MKAIFLVGGPGSGKDHLLRFVTESHSDSNPVEVQLDKLYVAITARSELPELNQSENIIVNGNAGQTASIATCRAVLEAMGYETAMLYVYTSDEASKARNDARIARGAKTFTEAQRATKYHQATQAMGQYSESFDRFWLFNNSHEADQITEEVSGWILELDQAVSEFLDHKYNSSDTKSENYSSTAVDSSRGNINVTDNGSPTENPATVISKVLKLKKQLGPATGPGVRVPDQNRANPPTVEATETKQKVKKPTQTKKNKVTGAAPPPAFFDGKMGMVPSGSLGITSEYKPSGTPLSEIRKKLKK